MHTQTYPHKHTYLPTPNNYLHTNTYLHTLSYLHKHFKNLFYIHLLTHTLTYTHTSTYMLLHTNSVHRPSGRADKINLTNAAALNPFQKICYKVLFRNVAPSRGPRLWRPYKIWPKLGPGPIFWHLTWFCSSEQTSFWPKEVL